MRKRIGALALSGAMLLAMTGCGMTTEKVVDRMYEAEIESYSSDIDVDFGLKIKAQGITIEVGADGEIEMETEQTGKDGMNVYMLLDLTASALGETVPLEYEAYILANGDELESYLLDPEDNVWYHTFQEAEGQYDEDVIKDIQKAVQDVVRENAELQKNTEKVGGEDCYVLTMNVGLDAFKDVYEIIFDVTDDTSDGELSELLDQADLTMDDIYELLSYLNLDMTLYTSKKDGYCRRAVVDCTDSDMDGLFDAIIDITGFDPSNSFFQIDGIEFTAFTIDMTLDDINDIEVEVPRNVEENAIESGSVSDLTEELTDNYYGF